MLFILDIYLVSKVLTIYYKCRNFFDSIKIKTFIKVKKIILTFNKSDLFKIIKIIKMSNKILENILQKIELDNWNKDLIISI